MSKPDHTTKTESFDEVNIHRNRNFKKLFYVILLLKLSLNLVIPILLGTHTRKGFFQPDEYYQTLDVAYNKTFGIPLNENTWEWNSGLRSYLFPLFIEVFAYRLFGQVIPELISLYLNYVKETLSIINGYWFQSVFLFESCQYIGLLSRKLSEAVFQYGIEYGPVVVMCVIGAITDYFIIALVYKIAFLVNKEKEVFTKTYANKVIKTSFLIVSTNFFSCFFQTRSFINTFEMFLNTLAFYFYDWDHENDDTLVFSFTLAFLAILQRPTNVFVWSVLGAHKLLSAPSKIRFIKLFRQVAMSLFFAFAITVVTDFYFYGQIIFPFINFIQFNFSKNLSRFYGSAPANFHIFQSVPLLNGITLPYYLISLVSITKSHSMIKWLHVLLILNLLLFSLIDHKEFRFLYPVQQIYLLLSIIQYFKTPLLPSGVGQLICYGSCAVGWILAYFNESGVIELSNYLNNNDIKSVSVLMPCHSLPGISYMPQYKGEIWQLSCDPPLGLLNETDKSLLKTKLDAYMDESDYFYFDSHKWIEENIGTGKNYQWTECVALFSNLSDEIYYTHLKPNGYILEQSWFNSLKHWDSRREGDVELYCRN